MQLIKLSSTKNLTISLGIAKMQAENSTDFGLIMPGAAFAAVPIIIVFLIFQLEGIALIFALNMLCCLAQHFSLQCLEYFGKFYEDGGKPFKPLMADTKYVDITK